MSKLESTSKTSTSAPTKHKISIQMPTSLPSSDTGGYTSVQSQSTSSLYAQSYPLQQHVPPPLAKGAPPHSLHGHKLPVTHKRDSTGALKTPANLAAANANAVADMESKAKKGKFDKDKKKKKIVRCAGGQTWEDDSLADWDTGKSSDI